MTDGRGRVGAVHSLTLHIKEVSISLRSSESKHREAVSETSYVDPSLKKHVQVSGIIAGQDLPVPDGTVPRLKAETGKGCGGKEEEPATDDKVQARGAVDTEL